MRGRHAKKRIDRNSRFIFILATGPIYRDSRGTLTQNNSMLRTGSQMPYGVISEDQICAVWGHYERYVKVLIPGSCDGDCFW
jgi:hypothetical protein